MTGQPSKLTRESFRQRHPHVDVIAELEQTQSSDGRPVSREVLPEIIPGYSPATLALALEELIEAGLVTEAFDTDFKLRRLTLRDVDLSGG